MILDLDVDGKPVAFEFLNASKLFKLNKNYLNDLKKINIQSTITEEAITLNVKLTVKAAKFSETAKQVIENAGGTVEVI